MNALFLIDEPSIFDETSEARARMRARAKAIGTLHIISPRASSYRGPALVQEENLSLHAFRAPHFFKNNALAKLARSIIIKNNIDIVSADDPFEYGSAAFEATRGTKAKLHIRVHTDFLSPWFLRSGISRSPQIKIPRTNNVCLRLADRVLPHADGISAVSKRVQESLVAHYGNSIPAPTFVAEEVSPELPPKGALPGHGFSFVLMTIGRLTAEKRIEDILVALARTIPLYPSVGLMIVGDGPERKRLEDWAQTLGLGPHVLFLGDRPDALGLLQQAHAYIQASAYTGYGRMLIEAALARVPIITTDVGIVGEVFKGYEDVLATPPGDPANLAVHITGFLEDVPTRQQFVMKAEKTARDYLAQAPMGPARIAADLQEVLQKSARTG